MYILEMELLHQLVIARLHVSLEKKEEENNKKDVYCKNVTRKLRFCNKNKKD